MLHPKRSLSLLLIFAMLVTDIGAGLSTLAFAGEQAPETWAQKVAALRSKLVVLREDLNYLVEVAGPSCSSRFREKPCPGVFPKSAFEEIASRFDMMGDLIESLDKLKPRIAEINKPMPKAEINQTTVCAGGMEALQKNTSDRAPPLTALKLALVNIESKLKRELAEIYDNDTARFKAKVYACDSRSAAFPQCAPQTAYQGVSLMFSKSDSWFCSSPSVCTGQEIDRFYKYAGRGNNGRGSNLQSALDMTEIYSKNADTELSSLKEYTAKLAAAPKCEATPAASAGPVAASGKAAPESGVSGQAKPGESGASGKAAAAEGAKKPGDTPGLTRSLNIQNGDTPKTGDSPVAAAQAGASEPDRGKFLNQQQNLDPPPKPTDTGRPGSAGSTGAADAALAQARTAPVDTVAPAEKLARETQESGRVGAGGVPKQDNPPLGGAAIESDAASARTPAAKSTPAPKEADPIPEKTETLASKSPPEPVKLPDAPKVYDDPEKNRLANAMKNPDAPIAPGKTSPVAGTGGEVALSGGGGQRSQNGENREVGAPQPIVEKGSIPTGAIVVGGLAVAAIGGGIYMATRKKSSKSDRYIPPQLNPNSAATETATATATASSAATSTGTSVDSSVSTSTAGSTTITISNTNTSTAISTSSATNTAVQTGTWTNTSSGTSGYTSTVTVVKSDGRTYTTTTTYTYTSGSAGGGTGGAGVTPVGVSRGN
jgi:hypothetical protein